jgi:uncharacterized spore protein YtfJ
MRRRTARKGACVQQQAKRKIGFDDGGTEAWRLRSRKTSRSGGGGGGGGGGSDDK